MAWEANIIDIPRMRETQLEDDIFITRYLDIVEFLGVKQTGEVYIAVQVA